MDSVEIKNEQQSVESEPAIEAPEPTLTKPPKKPRSQKQIEQFQKCQSARSEKCKQIRDMGLLQPPKVRRDHVYNLQTDMLHKQDEFLTKMNTLFDEFASLKQSASNVVVQSEAETSEFEMPARKPPVTTKKPRKKKPIAQVTDSESEGVSGPQPQVNVEPPPIHRQVGGGSLSFL